MIDFTDRKQLIDYLRFHGIRLDRRAGQHFLIDGRVLDRIMQAAELAETETVLEIGPGVGTLTQRLAAAVPRGLVLSVERDASLVDGLRRYFKPQSQVKIVHEDILRFNPREVEGDYRVVANVPYQITGAILRQFLTFGNPTHPPTRLVLMIQREVADRLLGAPGSSDRGVLTILRELFGPAERVTDAPAAAFFPPPEVDSTVVRIDRAVEFQENPALASGILAVARAGFSAKRRTLANALAGSWRLPKGEVEKLLRDAEIAPLARAEDLDLVAWQRLTQSWQAMHPNAG